MTFSVGVIYGVLGYLLLCETNAQYNGFGPNYNRDEYYRQYPQYTQYTQAQSNPYTASHGFGASQGINSNANSVHIIEIAIPDNPMFNGGKKEISTSEESLLKGVVDQLLSHAAGPTPYTFSIHTYSDNKTPYINPQGLYGNQFSSTPKVQSQYPDYKQPNYYQQMPSQLDKNQYYLKQQYQRELAIYEQKLREYYAKYPFLIPKQATTSLPPININELVTPDDATINHGKPISHEFPSQQNTETIDEESLLDLINEENEEPDSGKSLAELLGNLQEPSSTETPKKSLDVLIDKIFTGDQQKTTEAPPNGGGKSLFDLLAELPAISTDVPDVDTDRPTTKANNETTHKEMTNSDVAGGDFGLDVRGEEDTPTRTKRNILLDGFHKIVESISNFGKNDKNRHTRDHECNEYEGHSNHRKHGYNYGNDGFDEEHDRHRGSAHNHEHKPDHHSKHHFDEHSSNSHDYKHHSRPQFTNNNNEADENNFDYNEKHRPRPQHNKFNNEDDITNHSEKPLSQSSHHEEIQRPSQKPDLVDASTQTNEVSSKIPEVTKDPTLDIDVRGGFEETRRKRHNFKRLRRSPEEEIVFEDEGDTKPKNEQEAEKEEEKEVEKEEAKEVEEITEIGDVKTNLTEGEVDEKGELDSRFGFFGGGGGGFHRQGPGIRPIGGIISGVIGGVVGGFNAINQGHDRYNRPPPTGPYYPDQGHGHFAPEYPHQPPYGYGPNYPPPPQQQPVVIHINNVANAQSQATNTAQGPHGFGSNQNAAANAQSGTYQNEYGTFQNSGASGQASNLAADGSFGQLSAANAMNQNYHNEFGSGSMNTAQSQAANFDNHGNLALTSSNSGTNHFSGPGGVRDETNSAAQSSLQGQFGTQNSGAQSNTYQGPNGSGASASSQASNFNNGYGSQNTGATASANSGNIGGNSYGNAQSGAYANDQWGW